MFFWPYRPPKLRYFTEGGGSDADASGLVVGFCSVQMVGGEWVSGVLVVSDAFHSRVGRMEFRGF